MTMSRQASSQAAWREESRERLLLVGARIGAAVERLRNAEIAEEEAKRSLQELHGMAEAFRLMEEMLASYQAAPDQYSADGASAWLRAYVKLQEAREVEQSVRQELLKPQVDLVSTLFPRPGADHILQRVVRGHAGSVKAVKWHPVARNVMASGSSDRSVMIWTANERSRGYSSLRLAPEFDTVVKLSGHSSAVDCIDWHPEGDAIASGSRDNNVRVWSGGMQMAKWSCTKMV